MVHYTEFPIHKNSKFKIINWIDSCNVNNLTSSHTFIDKSEGKCVSRLMAFQDNVSSLGGDMVKFRNWLLQLWNTSGQFEQCCKVEIK